MLETVANHLKNSENTFPYFVSSFPQIIKLRLLYKFENRDWCCDQLCMDQRHNQRHTPIPLGFAIYLSQIWLVFPRSCGSLCKAKGTSQVKSWVQVLCPANNSQKVQLISSHFEHFYYAQNILIPMEETIVITLASWLMRCWKYLSSNCFSIKSVRN